MRVLAAMSGGVDSAVAAARLSTRLKGMANRFLPTLHDPKAARHLNAALGRLEFELAQAFVFFDTYMDVLTQRRPTELGAVLSGCDVLAREAMQPGDAILFRWRAGLLAKHAAILTDDANMIHAHDGAAVAEVALAPWWRRRLAYVFRFPGVS